MSERLIFTASRNRLESVTFGGNNSLWGLSLTNNRLADIDFHGAPSLYQVFLDENLLSSIDVSFLPKLAALSLSGNRFDFSNLPLQGNLVVYNYGNQAEIKIEDGEIFDLSYLAEREGAETEFKWFYDMPVFDYDNGVYTGEELVEGEEYVVNNGVTTFLADIDRVSCVMTNSLFPNLALLTNVASAKKHSSVEALDVDGREPVKVTVSGRDVTVSGLADGDRVTLVAADGSLAAASVAHSLGGSATATLTAPAPGFYLAVTPRGAVKLVVR